jgi:hypothetical protein
MELGELNADERIALVGLVMAVVVSDGRVSEDEQDEVAELGEAFGEAGYRAAVDAFETRFADEQAFKQFLRGITRPEARELIFGTVLEGASADAIAGHESELLSWVGKTWGIEVTVEEPLDDEDKTPS